MTTDTLAPPRPLTILHTSDWHLGRRLYGHARYEEFEAFLSWLEGVIRAQHVDVLIVAGDIFDTMTPSNRAQALYYDFLGKVSKTACQHVVIVAGNHDSPTFLDASKQVLKYLNVHVIGTACEDISDEVLILSSAGRQPQCIIAAVPYLRDRDVRTSEAGESAQDKDDKVVQGIRAHYDAVAAAAIKCQRDLQDKHHHRVPIVATGHLFAAGGSTTEDDGVRDLYVGNLGQIKADTFSPHFDYVALGHLHVPQKVGGMDHIRYSGSPLPMGFGEAKQQKQLIFIHFGDSNQPKSARHHNHNHNYNHSHSHSANPSPSPMIDDLFGFDTDTDTDIDQADMAISDTADTDTNQALDDCSDGYMKVSTYPIPTFQALAQITGDMSAITHQIKAQAAKDTSIWLEIVYNGHEIVSDLREHIHALVADTKLTVLKIQNKTQYNKTLAQSETTETLQDLSTSEVFERCLTLNNVADDQKSALRDAYAQIVHDMTHDDQHAE